jgi:hypothetical protein
LIAPGAFDLDRFDLIVSQNARHTGLRKNRDAVMCVQVFRKFAARAHFLTAMNERDRRDKLCQQQSVFGRRIATADYANIFAGELFGIALAADSIMPRPANSVSPGMPSRRRRNPVATIIAIDCRSSPLFSFTAFGFQVHAFDLDIGPEIEITSSLFVRRTGPAARDHSAACTPG